MKLPTVNIYIYIYFNNCKRVRMALLVFNFFDIRPLWILHEIGVFNKAVLIIQECVGMCLYIYIGWQSTSGERPNYKSPRRPLGLLVAILLLVFSSREHWDHTRFVIELLCFEHENMLVPTNPPLFLQLFFCFTDIFLVIYMYVKVVTVFIL